MRFFNLVILLIFFSAKLYSQKSIENTFEHQNSDKVRKLSARLTSKLNSDSEKIYAIHKWITHHIRYDVKKYLSNDYSHLSTRSIIRRKKATCVGYSDLFTEMCNYSDIECVNVPGYSKNIHVDLNDKIYLDDHMWNAVKVDETWKLVDVCWDAGHLTNHKKTLWGNVVYVFTFGKKTVYKRKLNFRKSPNEEYYLKSGKFFIADHLPLNPLWQLNSPVSSAEVFEKDSSHYLGEQVDSSEAAFSDNDSNERTRYAFQSDKEKYISDGFIGKEFNKRNNYRIGTNLLILAADSLNATNKKTKDTSFQRIRSHLILESLAKSDFYFSMNDSMLLEQERELLLKNDLKKNIFDTNFKALTSSTNKVILSTKDYKQFFKDNKKSTWISIKTNNRRIKGFDREKPISEMKSARRSSIDDSLDLTSQIATFSEIATASYDSLKHYYNYVDSLTVKYLEFALSHVENKKLIISLENYFIDEREEFHDDLDYEFKSESKPSDDSNYIYIENRDSFVKRKISNDLLLFVNDTSVFKDIRNKNQIAQNQLNQIYSTYRSKLTKLRKLKTKTIANDKIDDNYNNSVSDLINILEEFTDRESEWINTLSEIRSYSRIIYKQSTKELKIYSKEKKVEELNRNERIFHIKNQRAGLQKLNKQSKSQVNKLRGKTEKIIRKLDN